MRTAQLKESTPGVMKPKSNRKDMFSRKYRLPPTATEKAIRETDVISNRLARSAAASASDRTTTSCGAGAMSVRGKPSVQLAWQFNRLAHLV